MLKTLSVDYFGYTDLIRLENADTRVTLLANSGGRVLEYAWKGINALYQNPDQEGWEYSPDNPIIEPCAGRFDFGPETIVPRHPMLWLGPWASEILGPGAARLTSVADQPTGTRLVREFRLDKDSSRLTCTQTIINSSDQPTQLCHWSRTFAQGGGVCVVPLTHPSRFPKHYLRYEPEACMNFLPEDPNIRIREGYLEVLGPPLHSKLGLDSYAGWFAYIMRNGLVFLKGYPTYPDRVYNEMAGLTLSIWYPNAPMCELEPIGPRACLAPGESASFTETWWIGDYPFPSTENPVDLVHLADLAKQTVQK